MDERPRYRIHWRHPKGNGRTVCGVSLGDQVTSEADEMVNCPACWERRLGRPVKDGERIPVGQPRC